VDVRKLGGLSVSVVGLGCNQLGTTFCDATTSDRIVGEAIEAGITYFDTADEYGANYADQSDPAGWGRSEEFLGKALGKRRSQVLIGSKFGVQPHGDPTGGGGSARWARTAIEASLRRLGTDYIDLYQLHFPDPAVPIEETLGVLDTFVAEGKVREIGCCNFSAAQLQEAYDTADRTSVRRFASLQSPLNILQRASLDEIMPACQRLGMAFIPYYPLASGMLTGKYRRGEPLPAESRLADQVSEEARARIFSDRGFSRVEALEAYANERGHSLLELAFGWLLGYPDVATVIAGAAKPGQPTLNAAAAGWQLDPDEMAEVLRVVQEAAPLSPPER
jgi:aryl-alcohol dehydrogenase-like predicted oxidoreductase